METKQTYLDTSDKVGSKISSYSSGNTGISGIHFGWPIHEHNTELATLV